MGLDGGYNQVRSAHDTKGWRVDYYPPGKGADPRELKPGDIGLTRRMDSLLNRAVSFFDKGFYTHSFSVYKEGGIIAESLEWGVEVEDIEKYTRDHHYAIIKLQSNDREQENMFEFMRSVVNSDENRYGYIIVASFVLSKILGNKVNFGAGVGTRICSGFSAEVATRSGYIFGRPPAYTTPGDLQRHFMVDDPQIGVANFHKRATGEK